MISVAGTSSWVVGIDFLESTTIKDGAVKAADSGNEGIIGWATTGACGWKPFQVEDAIAGGSSSLAGGISDLSAVNTAAVGDSAYIEGRVADAETGVVGVLHQGVHALAGVGEHVDDFPVLTDYDRSREAGEEVGAPLEPGLAGAAEGCWHDCGVSVGESLTVDAATIQTQEEIFGQITSFATRNRLSSA